MGLLCVSVNNLHQVLSLCKDFNSRIQWAGNTSIFAFQGLGESSDFLNRIVLVALLHVNIPAIFQTNRGLYLYDLMDMNSARCRLEISAAVNVGKKYTVSAPRRCALAPQKAPAQDLHHSNLTQISSLMLVRGTWITVRKLPASHHCYCSD